MNKMNRKGSSMALNEIVKWGVALGLLVVILIIILAMKSSFNVNIF